jgi:hypothetical protein
MTKIDPTTFKPGDIVHVRGKVDDGGLLTNKTYVAFNDGDVVSVYGEEIVAHFPAIRSWSEIEGRLTGIMERHALEFTGVELITDIIALLNEIDPKGDA